MNRMQPTRWPGALLLATGLSLWCGQAVGGKVIHLAETSAGTGDGRGPDSPRSAAWFNQPTNWGAGAEQIGPGDTVRLGGTFTRRLTIQGSGTAAAPIHLVFAPGAKFVAPKWDPSGAIAAEGRHHLVLDGGSDGAIYATNNGTTLAFHEHGYGVVFTRCGDFEIRNLSLSNLYVRTPGSADPAGIGGGIAVLDWVSRGVIRNCRVSEANTGICVAYRGGPVSQDILVCSNRVSRVSNGILVGSSEPGALCRNVQLCHNRVEDLFVWDGTWKEPTPGHHHSDGIQCWAVHRDSLLSELSIHANHIGSRMGTHVTGWIFVEGNTTNVSIFNNLLTAERPHYAANGFITVGDGARVCHNTCVSWGGGVFFCGGGSGSVVLNNLVRQAGVYNARATNSIVQSDYNLFQGLRSGSGFLVAGRSLTLAQWRRRFDFDLNTLTADPMLEDVAAGDFRLTADSPARGLATPLAWITNDITGAARPANQPRDVGCYQMPRP